uniref:Uncharacterized protein n=1 Tax=Setaria digitata TaxID=48799 RepID=A0A915PTS4_9BILA
MWSRFPRQWLGTCAYSRRGGSFWIVGGVRMKAPVLPVETAAEVIGRKKN